MVFKFDLAKKAVECLENNPEQKFTTREIAKWIIKTYPHECHQKQERSTAKVNLRDSDAALINQIRKEVGWRLTKLFRKKDPNLKIKRTEGRPRKFYYTELSDSDEIDRAESNASTTANVADGTTTKKTEYDLYPVLAAFLWSELKIYSKRIDEKCSSNSHGTGGNRWLYPDLVGMEDLSQDWHGEIKNCVQQYSDKKTKLWSFEVKSLINRANVREAFFQAVSNSSWANFGYLVAGEIGGADTLKELRILAGLHGIGVIELDTESLSESQIMIPAKERSEIDWNTANRLAVENKDFLKYIKSIRQFYQTGGEVNHTHWDTQED